MNVKTEAESRFQTSSRFRNEDQVPDVTFAPHRAMLETKRTILQKLSMRMRNERCLAPSSTTGPFHPGLQAREN
jgi:hypothetical protein